MEKEVRALIHGRFSTALACFIESFIPEHDWLHWKTEEVEEKHKVPTLVKSLHEFLPSAIVNLVQTFVGDQDKLFWELMHEQTHMEALIKSEDDPHRLLRALTKFVAKSDTITDELQRLEIRNILADMLMLGLPVRKRPGSSDLSPSFQIQKIGEQKFPESDLDEDEEEAPVLRWHRFYFEFESNQTGWLDTFHSDPKDPTVKRRLQDAWCRSVQRTHAMRKIKPLDKLKQEVMIRIAEL